MTQAVGNTSSYVLDSRTIWLSKLLDEIHVDRDRKTHVLDTGTVKQVELDVNRSFSKVEERKLKNNYHDLLKKLILSVLERNEQLHYFQGFHDIASVFIIVFSDIDTATSNATLNVDFGDLTDMLYNFSIIHLRDFMMDNLNYSVDQLKMIPPIFRELDKGVYANLFPDSVRHLVISAAISCLLTLFSHDVEEPEVVIRVFTTVIEKESMIYVLYIYCLIIIQADETLLKTIEATREACLNENDFLNVVLQSTFHSKIDSVNWLDVFSQIRQLPKDLVPIKKYVNDFSVLRNPEHYRGTNCKHKLSTFEILLVKETKLNQDIKPTNNTSLFFSNAVRISLILGASAILAKYISEMEY